MKSEISVLNIKQRTYFVYRILVVKRDSKKTVGRLRSDREII